MINVTLNNSAIEPTNEHLIENESLSLKTLLAVTILLIYIVSGKIFQKFNFHIMHESGLCNAHRNASLSNRILFFSLYKFFFFALTMLFFLLSSSLRLSSVRGIACTVRTFLNISTMRLSLVFLALLYLFPSLRVSHTFLILFTSSEGPSQ